MIDWHRLLGLSQNVFVTAEMIYRPGWVATKQEYRALLGLYAAPAFPVEAVEVE